MFKKLFGAMLLTSQVAIGATVSSINKPQKIDISGFEQADNAAHMLDWLGKGKNFRQYIVTDIEKELYAQDKDSQLISVHCKSVPKYETKAIKEDGDSSKAIVTQFDVTFPLIIKIRAGNGQIWVLDVKHNYIASDLNEPNQQKLRFNFTIIGQSNENI